MIRKLRFLLGLVATSVLSLQAATVSGVVKEGDSTGVVVPNAIITLSSTGGGQQLLDTTDAAGAYSFTNVRIGNHQVRATKTGFTNPVQVAVNVTDSTAAYSANLFLVSNSLKAKVTGTVIDSSSAGALNGVQVIIRSGIYRDTILTSATGAYSFDSIPRGPFTLTVTLKGYTTRTVTGTVSSATVAPIEIKLVAIKYVKITGTITDSASGAVLKGAKVILQSGGSRDTVLTNETGVYLIDNVLAGYYSLAASLAGYKSKTVNVTVTGAAMPAVDVKLVAIVYAKITGTITDSASGAVLKGARVILQSGISRDTVLTNETGVYAVENVQTGSSYSLIVSFAGYKSKTVNGTVTSTAMPAVDVKLSAIAYSKITGTVTDTVSGAVLKGAQVILREGNYIDTVLTGETGVYTVDSVQAGIFSVTVSMVGYISKSVSSALGSAAPVPVDVKLRAITYGKLTGKVSGDSLKGIALAGVELILSVRNNSGTYTALDTAISTADGSYLFEHVQAAQNYRVSGSLTGYTSGSVLHNNQTSGTDTANLALVKVGSGTLLVRVFKKADSTAIAGASVVIISSGYGTATTLTGTSEPNGSAVFDKIEITGTTVSFSVTASANGYIASSGFSTIPKNGADTVKLYLVASTTGSKMLKGVVKDSTTKAVLANARIVLTITGAGAGGAQLTFIDTTDATGAYSFSGIPLTGIRGSVTSTLANYRNFSNNNVMIGTVNRADTTVLNVALLTAVSPVVISKTGLSGNPEFSLLQSGVLQLSNFNVAGTVKVFGINGKLVYERNFNAFTSSIKMPSGMAIRGNAFVISISQNNEIYRKQIIIP